MAVVGRRAVITAKRARRGGARQRCDCPACRDSGIRHVAWDHMIGSVVVACDCDDHGRRRAEANSVFRLQMAVALTIAAGALGYIGLAS